MFQRDPRAGAFLGGDRVSGQDIRDQNGASAVGEDDAGLLILSARSVGCENSHRCSVDSEHCEELVRSPWIG